MKSKVKQIGKKAQGHPVLSEFFKIINVIIGGLLVAFGLEAFLIPNEFLDGGVTGVSIILSKVFEIPMGFFLAVLNLPFVLLAWWKIGRKSAIRTSIGIATLSISTIFMHHMEPLTDEFFIALLLGGSLLGLGIGVALRQGGALDGTEALASIISNKSPFAVNQLILFINIGVFTVSAFVVGLESALASAVLFFFAVSPMIERVVDGNSEMKSVRIITSQPIEVAEKISKIVSRRISADKRFIYEEGKGFDSEVHELTLNISRLEESELTDTVLQADPDAIVMFNEISSLHGGIFEKDNESHH